MIPQTLHSSRSTKQRRAMQILMGLVELHIETGKPIGSQTLKQGGFDHMSSATLRNYFAHLETEGFLRQAHISGGRLPTDSAFRFYAEQVLDQLSQKSQVTFSNDREDKISPPQRDSELTDWIEAIGAALARSAHCGIALLLPRFTHDFAARIQLVLLNSHRVLAIICTQHGLVHTIVLHVEKSLCLDAIETVQKYCNWRINSPQSKSPVLDRDEEFCNQLHSEIMIRYFIENSVAAHRDLSINGLSEILHYPEGGNSAVFAEFVGLFENREGMQNLLNALQSRQGPQFWIGDALEPFFPGTRHCAVLGIPYQLHRTNVGALALVGPSRLPYRDLFAKLLQTCETLSRQLTQSVHKFNIELRSDARSKSFSNPLALGGKALLQWVHPSQCN